MHPFYAHGRDAGLSAGLSMEKYAGLILIMEIPL
jgi:tetrahydromethanopterin S-methyltransferase subunit F